MLTLLSAAILTAALGMPAQTERVARGFLFEEISHGGRTYRYVVYVPWDYDASRKWPVILFLHGMGECGRDGLKPLGQGIGTAIMLNAAKWPFIVVFPQKPEARDAWHDHEDAVMAMLDKVLKQYAVDETQQYLTGLSQGGNGTWVLGARHASRWAAIAPICGYGDPSQVAAALKDMPVWCFHGDADRAVPVEQSQKMVEAIKAAGGNPKLTIYPGVGHNSWDKAYRDEDLASWFLQHRRAAKSDQTTTSAQDGKSAGSSPKE